MTQTINTSRIQDNIKVCEIEGVSKRSIETEANNTLENKYKVFAEHDSHQSKRRSRSYNKTLLLNSSKSKFIL